MRQYMTHWSLESWQNYAYHQSVEYNSDELNHVLRTLSQLPPLVTRQEIHLLKNSIKAAANGKVFILQGGNCAESFAECHPDEISSQLKILLQMSLVLLSGLKKPIVRIGRIAGQYTKPRSSDFETIDGITLPSYRGDLVNSPVFSQAARTPNPHLLLKGYHCSAVTLNYIRALLNSGFADLKSLQEWNFPATNAAKPNHAYLAIVRHLRNILEIVDTFQPQTHFNLSEFFTSHEALHLHYEQALTRRLDDGHWYNLSAHLPWIGMRTATLDGAHIEFLRGVANPIGIKIGPHATPAWLLSLLNHLNPQQELGRILLITRMGADAISEVLPPLIRAVQHKNLPVAWSCDPMHGNTELTSDGIKTRHFDKILKELKLSLKIHHMLGSHLGGVHFELTGNHVTECIGGARGLAAHDLKHAYHSLVDPRLNYEQSLEMAIQFSQQYQKMHCTILDY